MKLQLRQLARPLSLTLLAALAFAWSSGSVQAQESDEDKEKLPPPVEVTLTTRDKVEIRCTYFGGTHKKDSVPVILLHQSGGNRHDWDDLAVYLQKTYGFAVIAPDLRGHGNSTNFNGQKVLAANMPLSQYPLMVTNDMEAVNQYLIERNNNGELNINKLSVVGAEMGAVVGMLWTLLDWSQPVLTTGKQGQDVKAVFMISPPFVFKNLSMQELTQPGPAQSAVRKQVSIYLAVGKSDPKALRNANRIYNLFEPAHKAAMGDPQTRDLFYEQLDTRLQGMKLIEEKSLKLGEHVGDFIDVRAAGQSYPWVVRKSPI
ncbi:MAG TPA: alpha/beta hydrolase [Pirellulales bacterium]